MFDMTFDIPMRKLYNQLDKQTQTQKEIEKNKLKRKK